MTSAAVCNLITTDEFFPLARYHARYSARRDQSRTASQFCLMDRLGFECISTRKRVDLLPTRFRLPESTSFSAPSTSILTKSGTRWYRCDRESSVTTGTSNDFPRRAAVYAWPGYDDPAAPEPTVQNLTDVSFSEPA